MARSPAIAALGLCLWAAPAPADTVLNGEYNIQIDLRKQDRNYDWNFDANNNDTYSNAQLRLFSQPFPGVEAFLRTEAEWHSSDNNTSRPLFQYREADLRYRWDLGGRGFDSFLFSRQNRFWVENHLIQVVQSDPPSDGGNAQGFRVDSWGFLGGLNGTFIYSDYSSQFDPTGTNKNPLKTDDAVIVRLRDEFLGRKLRAGFTYNRKLENQLGEGPNAAASVIAGDLRYNLHNVDFSLEYAQSITDSTRQFPSPSVSFPEALDQKFLGIPLSDRGVWVGEIRSIQVGSPMLGFLNFAPVGWLRGPRFDNRLGDSNRDERGYTINTWYLVPGRAITLSNNLTRYEKQATIRRKVTEWYSEAYIEFVNGFTGKVFYRNKRTTDDPGLLTERVDRNDDLFGELQVESKLAWLRVEGKLKNLGTRNEKQLASIETSVNIGPQTKLYNRLMFGNDPTGLRRILFSQIQYRPAGNMDFFLEYGPSWIGDSQRPVDDGDLEGSGVQKDLIKLFVKGTF